MSEFLKAVSEFMAQRKHETVRVAEMCAEGDAQVLELNPGSPLQNLYSVAKTFVVTGVGLLYDRGLLSVEEAVPKALGALCPASYNPLWNDTAVHMLLKHRVGLEPGCLDIDVHNANEFGEDFLSYTMNLPLSENHTKEYNYTDAAFYMLSCIVENRAGMPLDAFLQKEVFLPLGFAQAGWVRCPKGHAMGATGLFLKAEDMVKLGWLYLNGGVWRSKRILSENWVKTAIENEYEFSQIGEGAYAKGGMYGQFLLAIPSENRAVAWQAASGLGQDGLAQFAIHFHI